MCCDSWGHKESDTTEQLHIVPFVAQKLLILIRPHLFIFAFISNILEGGS